MKTFWLLVILAALCSGSVFAGEPWVECEDDFDCDDDDACTLDFCFNHHCYHEEDECDNCCDKCDPDTGYCNPRPGSAGIWAPNYLAVNDNDDDFPLGSDASNSEIDGQADLADIALIKVTAPGWREECNDHSVTLEVSGEGTVRIFAFREVDAPFILLGLGSVEMDPQEGPDWNLGIEGVAPGEITLHVTHRCDGAVLGEDEATLTVVQAQLDVNRTYGTVDQEVEYSEGTIAKVFVPGIDTDPFPSQRVLPTVNVLPSEILDNSQTYLRKRFPEGNQGAFSVLRNGVEILAVGQNETLINPAQLGTGNWMIQAFGTGAMDLFLEVEIGGQVIHSDQIRAFATLSMPGGGRNHVVNPNAAFDIGTYTAYTSITAALAAAGQNENVIVTRGTYNEASLTVGSQVRVLGLGGMLDPQLAYRLVPTAMPVVNGGNANAVFIVSGLSTHGPTISGLEITGGRSAEGGGIRIKNCTSPVQVEYNHIRQNAAMWPTPFYGGGIFVEDSGVLIRYNVIEHNQAGGGGGTFCRNVKDAVIEFNHIKDNHANYGAGIGVQGNTGGLLLTIRNNVIKSNTASVVGGGVGVVGDHDDYDTLIGESIHSGDGGHPTIITDNEIRGNSVPGFALVERGGGVYNGGEDSHMMLNHNQITNNSVGGDGGGVCIFNKSCVDALGNTITNNTAGDDGGGFNHGTYSSGVWKNNTISGNIAANNGGGFHGSVSIELTIEDNLFQSNQATNLNGGGISLRNSRLNSLGGNIIEQNSAGRNGGGISFRRVNDWTPTLVTPGVFLAPGDIVRNNTAGAIGGAVYCYRDWRNAHVNFNGVAFSANSGTTTVAACRTDGLYLYGFQGNKTVIIQECKIFDHEGAGLTCDFCFDREAWMVTISINANVFRDNGHGINSTLTTASIFNNQFLNNKLVGVRIGSSLNQHLKRNTFQPGGRTARGIEIDRSNYGGYFSATQNNFVGFTGPAQDAIFVVILSSDFVNAQNNWWNHALGPHDPLPGCTDGSCNNNPPGDNVGNCVDYSSWSITPN